MVGYMVILNFDDFGLEKDVRYSQYRFINKALKSVWTVRLIIGALLVQLFDS